MKILAIAAAAAFIGLLPAAAFAQNAACTTPDQPMPHPVMATHTLPPYPAISFIAGEQGTTDMLVTIGTDGNVAEIALTGSSSSNTLDNAAMLYVKAHYKWLPAIKNCVPQIATVKLRIFWSLANSPLLFNLITPGLSDYPPEAVSQHEQGLVAVTIVVNAENATTIAISTSSGYAELDTASLTLVEGHHWAAAQMDGKAIVSNLIVYVSWKLPPAPAK